MVFGRRGVYGGGGDVDVVILEVSILLAASGVTLPPTRKRGACTDGDEDDVVV